VELGVDRAGPGCPFSFYMEFHRLALDEDDPLAQHPLRACLPECHASIDTIGLAAFVVTFCAAARKHRERPVPNRQSEERSKWPAQLSRLPKHRNVLTGSVESSAHFLAPRRRSSRSPAGLLGCYRSLCFLFCSWRLSVPSLTAADGPVSLRSS